MVQGIKTMEIKSIDESTRTFKGYLSVYGVKDRDGDVFTKGAFAEDIAKKDTTVMLYQHITNDMKAIIGSMKLSEDEKGVFVEANFFEKDIEPNAEKIYQLVKAGALTELSVGFGVESAKDFTGSPVKGYVFNKAYIREGSVVMKASNQESLITEVKSNSEPTEINRKDIIEKLQKARKEL